MTGGLTGVRINCINDKWKLVSKLLAIKLFKPTTRLVEEKRLSDLLYTWFKYILEEYSLSPSHLFGATTDKGSDVKRMCTVVARAKVGHALLCKTNVDRPPYELDVVLTPQSWVWCIAHMIHNTLVEAFGINLDKKKGKNPEARRAIGKVKRCIESINKSSATKVTYAHQCNALGLHCNSAGWQVLLEEMLLESWGFQWKLVNAASSDGPAWSRS
jgi:hypothetical protein